jgi:hypothetical protein
MAAAAAMFCACDAYADAFTCSDLGAGFRPGSTRNISLFISLQTGETVTLKITDAVDPVVVTSPISASLNSGQSTSYTATSSGLVRVVASSAVDFLSTVSCTAAVPPSGGSAQTQPTQQQVNNANTAVSNGQQTLDNLNSWVSNGVQGGFGLIGGEGGGGAEAPRPKKQLQASTPARRLEELKREELSLREERQERPDDPALEQRLAAVRRDLTYVRITASIAPPVDPADGHRRTTSLQARTALAEADRARQAMRAETATTTDGEKRPSAPTSFSFHSSDLIDLCESDGETSQLNPAVEMLGRKWNVWMEGRLVGAWDSLAQTNAFGFIGAGGVDYKFKPWLAVGMSVGVETFETKFGFNSVRLGSVGLSAVPYVGFRLTDNVFASAFVGLTQITYNGNPQLGDTANFTALRVMFGGSLFGQWQYGDWRVRPILSGSYASESQNGYTDSLGNVVSGQTVTYGRISAGPEVGYTFWGPERSWSVQPYVLAKANLDFASSNAVLLQGQSVVLRPGTLGSGSAGLGVDTRFSSGFYLRVQGSYDSIGVTGLDVLTGMIRGGITF